MITDEKNYKKIEDKKSFRTNRDLKEDRFEPTSHTGGASAFISWVVGTRDVSNVSRANWHAAAELVEGARRGVLQTDLHGVEPTYQEINNGWTRRLGPMTVKAWEERYRYEMGLRNGIGWTWPICSQQICR